MDDVKKWQENQKNKKAKPAPKKGAAAAKKPLAKKGAVKKGPAAPKEEEPVAAAAPPSDAEADLNDASVDAQAEDILSQIKNARIGMSSMGGNSDIDESALSAAMAGMNLVQTDAAINHKQQSKSDED